LDLSPSSGRKDQKVHPGEFHSARGVFRGLK